MKKSHQKAKVPNPATCLLTTDPQNHQFTTDMLPDPPGSPHTPAAQKTSRFGSIERFNDDTDHFYYQGENKSTHDVENTGCIRGEARNFQDVGCNGKRDNFAANRSCLQAE